MSWRLSATGLIRRYAGNRNIRISRQKSIATKLNYILYNIVVTFYFFYINII